MDVLALFPVFVVGLLGSVHCAGMCGGIVGALSVAPAVGRPVPVSVRVAAARPPLANVLAYNAGRVGSYMVAGALAGAAVGRVLAGEPDAGRAGPVPDGCVARPRAPGAGRAGRVARHAHAVRPARPAGRTGPHVRRRRLVGLAAVRDGLQRPRHRHAERLGKRRRPRDAGVRSRHPADAAGPRPAGRACGILVLGFGLLGLARAAGGLPHGAMLDLCVAPGAA